MKRVIVLALVSFGLSGCAQTIWDKPGATQADYNKDTYECEKDTRQSGYFGGGLVGSMRMKEFYGKCMVAHGWTARN